MRNREQEQRKMRQTSTTIASSYNLLIGIEDVLKKSLT